MTVDHLHQLEILNEIAMSIGSSLDERRMLDDCLPLMLRRLGGRSVQVFEDTGDGLERIYGLPHGASADTCIDTARGLIERGRRERLRYLREETATGHCHAWHLPGLGVLVLGRSRPLDHALASEISLIARRLATALLSCRQFEQLRETRARLAREASFHRTTLQAIGDAILITDNDGRIREFNPAAEQLTGRSREAVLGHAANGLLRLIPHEPRPDEDEARDLPLDTPGDGDALLLVPGRAPVAVHYGIRRIDDVDGGFHGMVIVLQDISERHAMEREIAWRATHDPLTGLPNRALLTDHLQWSIHQADRHERLLAVALIDLDEFKPVNDRLGHAAGDRLLCEVAERMQRRLRATDTLARLGGDEFVVLLNDLRTMAEAEQIFARLVEDLSTPFLIENERVTITASLGYTLYPLLDEADADTLLRHADQAMYSAKSAGRNRFQLFDTLAQQHREYRHSQQAMVRQALERGQFELHYQPQVDMRAGRILGFEALARWRHPERGLLGPEHFLPWIEQDEPGWRFGRFVLEDACRQLAHWRERGHPWSVSVNITPDDFLSPDFLPRLDAALEGSGGQTIAARLEIEIVESAAISNLELAVSRIRACHERGVRVAMDDFGVGHASLTYLKRLPVDRLKIDRSFIHDMSNDRGDLLLVESVITLSRLFGHEVIAEGVETVAQGRQLIDLGCHVAQGFLIARPMPAAQVPGWASGWSAPAAWRDAGEV